MTDLEVTKRGSKTTNKDFQAHPKEDEPSKDTLNSRGFPSDRTVWIVFFSLLVDLLAFTVILPLFPSLLEFYASTEVSCNSSLVNIKFEAEMSCPIALIFNHSVGSELSTCITCTGAFERHLKPAPNLHDSWWPIVDVTLLSYHDPLTLLAIINYHWLSSTVTYFEHVQIFYDSQW